MLFNLRYTLRQWQKRKFQTLTLILCLSLFCAFTANLIATAPALFSDRQPWMSGSTPYITIGLESHSGKFNPIDKTNLDRFTQSPAIGELMTLTNRTLRGLKDQSGVAIDDAGAVYLPPSFIDRFADELPPVMKKLSDTRVILSYPYWQSLGAKPIEELAINASLTGAQLPVAGVLPKGFRLFQGIVSDIVLTDQQVASTFGINFGANKPPDEYVDKIINQLVESVAFRYGVAELKPGYEPEDVSAITLAKEEASDGSVVLLSGTASWTPKVIEGLQFHPQQRQRLIDQWQMLLGLTLGFLLIGLFNLLTSNFSEYLQREQEFQTRKAVGASNKDLIRQLLTENSLLGFVSVVLGVVLSWYILKYVEAELVLVSLLSSEIKATGIILSVLLTATVVILVGLLPFLSLNRQARFSRSKSNGQGRLQRWLNAGNMTVQIALALVAITCSISLWLTQEQQLEQVSVNTDIIQLSYKQGETSSDPVINLNEWKSKLANQPFDVAMSVDNFIDSNPSATQASTEGLDSPSAIPIQIMSVSDNYFNVLEAAPVVGDRNPAEVNQVIINETAARELGFKQPKQALQQTLFVKDASSYQFTEDEPIIIVGVSKDLPHSSLNQNAQPMIYNLLRESGQLLREIYLYAQPTNVDAVVELMQQQAASRENMYNVNNDGALLQLLKQQDEEWFVLAQLLLGLTLLICALAATSLYQQIVAYVIQRSRLYAVMQAVGAQVSDVAKSISRMLATKLLSGLILGVIIIAAINSWFFQQFHAELFTVHYLVLSLVAILLLVLLSYIPAIWRQLSLPIQRILRDE
ncbi:FtsX-like permease family protein [Idiomarina sp.]|uniref:FtsX-like permease family protein n=1 Tax=Idiomarina sp. TaxID=1874361 RepID=UPI0025C5B89B|nr:FtsX-like permease family protein [Idiomarina sp.]NQZ03126.1 FtsX-like permease family protein [Idiomarina sp.]